jgi:hypothetical protein
MEKTVELNETELKQRILSDQSILSDLTALLNYLPDSEYELILFMVQKKVWQGFVPPAPSGFKAGDGSIELGLILYWLKNPSQIDFSKFTAKEKKDIMYVIDVIDFLLADSQMTLPNYNFFIKNELIYTDGTVLAMRKWATYDQGWFIAFINLLQSVINASWYSGEDFPTTVPPTIQLKGAAAGKVTIALIGDWGTGDVVSKAIINQVTALKPDYIVHVGDVYYSGTPLATDPNGQYYFDPGEEQNNLLVQWPPTYAGRSFTLNSNHEMYSGANGLFYRALAAKATPPGKGSVFSAQKGASCFALQYAGWTILGLDSAYMAKIDDAFMTGSIGGYAGFQGKWIQSLKLNPAKTIVFTHHNGFADDCTSVSPLWAEITGSLKGDPYAWYWGHVHNGIVYNQPLSIPGLNTKTFARCLGHAALPYGPASSLNGKPIAYKASNLQPSPSKQLYNGFAMITLQSANNVLTSITENFYDLSKALQPVWAKRIL